MIYHLHQLLFEVALLTIFELGLDLRIIFRFPSFNSFIHQPHYPLSPSTLFEPDKMRVQLLSAERIADMLPLVQQLNRHMAATVLQARLEATFKYEHYRCFGLFENDRLIGVSSGWLTTRLYCGRQLELDNVVMDERIQSKGYGRFLLNEIEKWAIAEGCETIELNTYMANARSHKFYFNLGYHILGFHFQKNVS